MIEWVVTLRNGQRHDVEAEAYMRRELADGSVHHEFHSPHTPPPRRSRTWPLDHVTLVQRRDGHHLEQVWP